MQSCQPTSFSYGVSCLKWTESTEFYEWNSNMKIIGSLIQEEDESGNEGYSDQKQGYKNRADRGGYTEMKEQIYQVKVYLTPYYSSHTSDFHNNVAKSTY